VERKPICGQGQRHQSANGSCVRCCSQFGRVRSKCSRRILADRTNGRAYAENVGSVCLSVVCNVMYCGLTVRPRAKVTIDSLVAYEKSIGTKMNENDLDLCLEVVLMTCQPLRHIRRRISRNS